MTCKLTVHAVLVVDVKCQAELVEREGKQAWQIFGIKPGTVDMFPMLVSNSEDGPIPDGTQQSLTDSLRLFGIGSALRIVEADAAKSLEKVEREEITSVLPVKDIKGTVN